MPAVATQQLAQIADLIAHGPPQAALAPVMGNADVQLRRASGEVLSAYAKRMHRTAGASFKLATWGDFTIGLVVDIAVYRMLFSRGFNPSAQLDKTVIENYTRAVAILDEIVDITNKTPRIDPDAVGTTDVDEEGPLAFSEGGAFDEADAWAQPPRGAGLELFR